MRDMTPAHCRRDGERMVADLRCPDRVVLRDGGRRFIHAADIGPGETVDGVIAALMEAISDWARGHVEYADVRTDGTVAQRSCW